jgi:hypothetical protein
MRRKQKGQAYTFDKDVVSFMVPRVFLDSFPFFIVGQRKKSPIPAGMVFQHRGPLIIGENVSEPFYQAVYDKADQSADQSGTDECYRIGPQNEHNDSSDIDDLVKSQKNDLFTRVFSIWCLVFSNLTI